MEEGKLSHTPVCYATVRSGVIGYLRQHRNSKIQMGPMLSHVNNVLRPIYYTTSLVYYRVYCDDCSFTYLFLTWRESNCLMKRFDSAVNLTPVSASVTH